MAKPISPAKAASPFFARGNYVTGFCATGAHEGIAPIKSPSGVKLKPCKGLYSVPVTHYTGKQIEIKCSCSCHEAFEEIRAMMALTNPPVREIPTLTPPRTIQETTGRTGGPGPADRPAAAESAPVAPTSGGGLMPFQRTTTDPIERGHQRRGVLEERVRQVVAKYHVIAAGMLTPKMIALYIDKKDPPSSGAVDAVLKRWEERRWITLDKKPTTLGTVTELGRQKLIR